MDRFFQGRFHDTSSTPCACTSFHKLSMSELLSPTRPFFIVVTHRLVTAIHSKQMTVVLYAQMLPRFGFRPVASSTVKELHLRRIIIPPAMALVSYCMLGKGHDDNVPTKGERERLRGEGDQTKLLVFTGPGGCSRGVFHLK